jgi:hypothetical protein
MYPTKAYQLDPALPPDTVFQRLDPAVRTLVLTNHMLYAGNWDDMEEDIRRRQAGRPYLFKIPADVEDLLGWVHVLKDYEAARGERFSYVIPL